MNSRQWKELLAARMVGEGIICLLAPAGYYRLWSSGPYWNLPCLKKMSERPSLIRTIGAAELIAGLWLSRRQLED